MARTRWSALSERTRRLIIVGGVVDTVLKIAALVDLARRPATGVRGSKRGWAAAIVLTNSIGAVPVTYFVYGRRPSARPS